MSINRYTRDFKAKVDLCKVVGSDIGIIDTTTKLACLVAGENYNTLVLSNNADNIATLKKMQQLGQD